jgi:hypothetical protein
VPVSAEEPAILTMAFLHFLRRFQTNLLKYARTPFGQFIFTVHSYPLTLFGGIQHRWITYELSNIRNESHFPDSLSLFPIAPTSEQRESVKRFASLQFLNPKTVGGTPWTGESARRKAATYTGQHKRRVNADSHPCHESDLSPRPQHSSGWRQFMP